MKILRSTVPGITLAILMLALASACSQPATNTNGAGTTSNTNASKPAATTTPATTAAAPAGALSTPTNTFMAFYEASKKNDVPGVIRILSKDSLDFLTAEAKKENKTLETALTESLKTADVPKTTPETRNEKIDGDKATLEVKDDKSSNWDTFNFVKENNEWKLKLGIE
jgi:septal ring-binding cell division protein DamX